MDSEIDEIKDELNKKNQIEISNIIHEVYYNNQIPRLSQQILFLISFVLSIVAIYFIGTLQYEEYHSLILNKTSDLNKTQIFCGNISKANINLVSTPIAIFLILLYVVIYKRRVFWTQKFKYRNIGLPFIITCWNKSDRMYTSLTYGIIYC